MENEERNLFSVARFAEKMKKTSLAQWHIMAFGAVLMGMALEARPPFADEADPEKSQAPKTDVNKPPQPDTVAQNPTQQGVEKPTPRQPLQWATDGMQAASDQVLFAGKSHWNEAEKAFFSQYLFIRVYDSRVIYHKIPGEKILKPISEEYQNTYFICERVTQDGTFQQIVPVLNPSFFRALKRLEDSRSNFDHKVFEREMLEESAKVAAIVFAQEMQKIPYLDPFSQPEEYIDRGNIVITEIEKGIQLRRRINERYGMRQLTD